MGQNTVSATNSLVIVGCSHKKASRLFRELKSGTTTCVCGFHILPLGSRAWKDDRRIFCLTCDTAGSREQASKMELKQLVCYVNCDIPTAKNNQSHKIPGTWTYEVTHA